MNLNQMQTGHHRHLVTILRPATDSTANGVTSPARSTGARSAILIDPDTCAIDADTPSFSGSGFPVLVLKRRPGMAPVAVPVAEYRRGAHTCAGGNYVNTSDGRFRERVAPHPIAVHDRVDFRGLS